jgi:hypothetical protein
MLTPEQADRNALIAVVAALALTASEILDNAQDLLIVAGQDSIYAGSLPALLAQAAIALDQVQAEALRMRKPPE